MPRRHLRHRRRRAVDVRGRLSPFIELGVGFNPDLTARDNVIINAIMLGLSRKEARERFDEIIAFAELEEFLDLKLKNYSSGMHVRLAFSVAIQVDADILLIDEVLAVGDAAFQQKCFDEFHRLKDEGRTIVFVTHDMGAVERFCDRAMLHRARTSGDDRRPGRVAREYNELNFGAYREEAQSPSRPGAPPRDAAGRRDRRRVVRRVAPTASRSSPSHQGEPCAVRMRGALPRRRRGPDLRALALRNDAGRSVFAASTELDHGPTGHFAAGRRDRRVRLRFENCSRPAATRSTASVARAGLGDDALDSAHDARARSSCTAEDPAAWAGRPAAYASRSNARA